MKNLFSILILSTSLVYILSCANIKTPTGGPQDLAPPKVKSTNPDNYTTNFKGGEITINFNEPIVTKNLAQNFFISPSLKTQPKIKVKKKSIVIQIPDSLKPNTTYTLTFKEAIADLNEGNPLKEFKYVFSTGSVIDSLFIEGEIKNEFTGKPMENILISLYKHNDQDTLTVSNSIPDYFTYTNKQGKYSITNIKNGNYDLFAIGDNNLDLKYSGGNESIDFQYNVAMDSGIIHADLFPNIIDTTKPSITDIQSVQPFISALTFTEGLLNIVAKTIGGEYIFSTIQTTPKNVNLYNTQKFKDSINVLIFAKDSAENILKDTIKISFQQPENIDSLNPVMKNVIPSDFKLKRNNAEVIFKFNYPIYKPKKSPVSVPEKLLEPINTNDTGIYLTEYKMLVKNTLSDTIIIISPDSLFTSPIAAPSIRDTTKFTYKQESEIGSIEGQVQTQEESFILQLLDEKLKIIEERRNEKNFYFSSLKAGNYYFRIIVDNNNNAKWDQANLEKRKKAESVIFYSSPIKVKENWEIQGITLKL